MSSPTSSPTGQRVTLREVTRETLRSILRLKVAPSQERLVANNAVSIAQAHFHPEAWFRAIYAGESPVGFLMLADDAAKPEYYLWRFMIDKDHQGKGYGREAIRLLLEHVRTRPGATELLLSHVEGEGSPGPFYEKLGFEYTGEKDPDGEVFMRIRLTPPASDAPE